VGADPQAAGPRVLRPLRAPRGGRRLRDLPRPHRSDGSRARRDPAQHGLVPRVPPRSQAEPPAEGPNHQHGMDGRQRAGLDAARREPAAALLGVPPMSRREPRELPAPQDGAKVFWSSLTDKANAEEAKKRAATEPAVQGAGGDKLVTLRRGKDEKSADAG